MRVGFISTYPPIECGIATYTQALERALRRARKETFVISPLGARGDGVFGLYPAGSDQFAPLVFRTSVSLTPDVVHVQHEFGLFGSQRGVEAVDLLLRYRIAGVPTVTTMHTVNDDLDKAAALITRELVEQSSAVVVHESSQKDTLLRVCPAVKAESVHVIEHGVREIEPVADAKRKLGLEGKRVLLLCGYFRPTKGFHRVAEIYPQICERLDDVVLVVAGKSRNIEFDDYRRELLATLEASPVADRIVVLHGQFPQHTFDTIVSAADVVLLPYEKGAQSGILSQCFALARPVVVSGLRAFRDVVERCGGGVVAESDAEFVSASVRLLEDERTRRACQARIRAYVGERAGWSHIAAKHLAVYESVITAAHGDVRTVYFPESERDVATTL